MEAQRSAPRLLSRRLLTPPVVGARASDPVRAFPGTHMFLVVPPGFEPGSAQS